MNFTDYAGASAVDAKIEKIASISCRYADIGSKMKIST